MRILYDVDRRLTQSGLAEVPGGVDGHEADDVGRIRMLRTLTPGVSPARGSVLRRPTATSDEIVRSTPGAAWFFVGFLRRSAAAWHVGEDAAGEHSCPAGVDELLGFLEQLVPDDVGKGTMRLAWMSSGRTGAMIGAASCAATVRLSRVQAARVRAGPVRLGSWSAMSRCTHASSSAAAKA